MVIPICIYQDCYHGRALKHGRSTLKIGCSTLKQSKPKKLMYKLTVYTTNGAGRKTFKDFEDTTQAKANNQAQRFYGRREYSFDNCKQIVRVCAQSSEVANIVKSCVL
jgi:hypothetical protein